MNFFKIITSFLFFAVAKAAAGGLAVSAPLVARNVLSSPLLTGEVLAPTFARAAPLVASAPLLAQATVGYASSIPQNIPPFASQVSIVNRALSGYVAAPLSSAYFTSPAAVPVLRSPLAYTASPFVSSLPFYRSALATPLAAPLAARFAAPLAAPLGAPLAAPLTAPIAAPLALSAPTFPLQTQALFGRALAPAPVPVGVATTRLVPTGDAASETVPQSDEDPSVEAVRNASQESNDAQSDDSVNQSDENANVENAAPEDQPSN